MLSFLHVFISSVIQFDKSIHPVVLNEYYLICLFIKMHKLFLMRQNHVKAINPRDGGGGWFFDLPCTHCAFSNACQTV